MFSKLRAAVRAGPDPCGDITSGEDLLLPALKDVLESHLPRFVHRPEIVVTRLG
jgi:hypothetical protein